MSQARGEKLLIPALGDVALSKLRSDLVAEAYDRIQAENPKIGPATIRRIHATFSSALNSAVGARRIDFNPAAHVHLPAHTRPQVRPWEPAELGKFLDHAANHRDGIVFEVIASTGMRRGEALGLRWSDIDLEAGVIVARLQLLQVGSEFQFGPLKTVNGQDRVIELTRGRSVH